MAPTDAGNCVPAVRSMCHALAGGAGAAGGGAGAGGAASGGGCGGAGDGSSARATEGRRSENAATHGRSFTLPGEHRAPRRATVAGSHGDGLALPVAELPALRVEDVDAVVLAEARRAPRVEIGEQERALVQAHADVVAEAARQVGEVLRVVGLDPLRAV